MRRHGEQCAASKENTRPVGTSSVQQQPVLCPALVRRPLGERKPSNRVGVDIGPCIKWLEGAVALSRATAASKQQSLSPPRSSTTNKSNARGAPAALPSCSPDIIRKKSASRNLEDCFAVGPTVKGNVKDRRKSKPRALLTVEALPNVATLTLKEFKCLPQPGRASLEWISDDPDSEAADSNTDLSGTCDGSSESSLCCGFAQQWQDLRASQLYDQPACQDEEDASSSSISQSPSRGCCTVGKFLPAKETVMKREPTRDSSVEVDIVLGGYDSCLMNSRSISCSLDGLKLAREDIHKVGAVSERATHLKEGTALQKLDGMDRKQSELNEFNRTGGYDSLADQVRSLQDELRGLLCSDVWKS